MKKALITGISGQDGSYLAELLLSKKYEVTGMVRRTSTFTLDRISNLLPNSNLTITEGDLSDMHSVYNIIQNNNFDEIYNLAAQSHVATSFEQPNYTFNVDCLGVINLLEAIRRYSPKTRFYQASTSEMFGSNYDVLDGQYYQDENTKMSPQSPYACAKLAAHNLIKIYRSGYNIHASSGILFNHESERRGENFVTRKITKWIGAFCHWEYENPEYIVDDDYLRSLSNDSLFPKLRLGNLDACRDWGHAEDYVEAMWLMLQKDNPDDYVISTGETHTVRDFLKEAFNIIEIDNYQDYIVQDPKFYRPAEVEYLLGHSNKARQNLNWSPKISFCELVKRMVRSDINEQKTSRQKVF